MKFEYKVIGDKLITNNFEKKFKYTISKVIVIDEIYVVLINIPKGSQECNNVYGVSIIGEIIWRIQSPEEAFNIQNISPYVYLDIDDRGKLSVTNFYGMRYFFDHITGYLTEKISLGW